MLPYRVEKGDGLRFAMITSRRRGRWILPKGWPQVGEGLSEAACQEAREEAGLDGTPAPIPIGRYRYGKIMRDGYEVPCLVTVYAMKVTGQRKDWPEKDERTLEWVHPRDAAERADDAGLRRILARLAQLPDDRLRDYLKRPTPLEEDGIFARLRTALGRLVGRQPSLADASRR